MNRNVHTLTGFAIGAGFVTCVAVAPMGAREINARAVRTHIWEQALVHIWTKDSLGEESEHWLC